MRLTIVPMELDKANDFTERFHRHHGKVQGHKFSLGVAALPPATPMPRWFRLCGVATVGRPTARHRQDGWTLEVTRLTTDGTPNACSALYAACWRATKAMGYLRLGTYIQDAESGVSLKAAGWRLIATRPARGGWDTPSRPRLNQENPARQLWEVSA